jgi:hypothetical protein
LQVRLCAIAVELDLVKPSRARRGGRPQRRMTRLDKSGERGLLRAGYHAGINVASVLRHHAPLPPLVAPGYLPAMITKEEDIAYWTVRVGGWSVGSTPRPS